MKNNTFYYLFFALFANFLVANDTQQQLYYQQSAQTQNADVVITIEEMPEDASSTVKPQTYWRGIKVALASALACAQVPLVSALKVNSVAELASRLVLVFHCQTIDKSIPLFARIIGGALMCGALYGIELYATPYLGFSPNLFKAVLAYQINRFDEILKLITIIKKPRKKRYS